MDNLRSSRRAWIGSFGFSILAIVIVLVAVVTVAYYVLKTIGAGQ